MTRVDSEDRWQDLLTPAEADASRRNRVETVRRTSVVSRGLQRLVGAHYLSTPPHDLRIDRACDDCGSTSHGRPRWVDATGLDYSTSHSGGWVVLAVVGSGRVGVDLEFEPSVDSPDGVDELAAVVLTAAELATYESLRRPARAEYLCRMWVRKEAALKATGQGLGLAPSAIDVRGPRTVAPGSGPPLTDGVIEPPSDLVSDQCLHLRDVPTERGYRAALASTQPIERVTYMVNHGPSCC